MRQYDSCKQAELDCWCDYRKCRTSERIRQLTGRLSTTTSKRRWTTSKDPHRGSRGPKVWPLHFHIV